MDEDVKFVTINGRIVPIKPNPLYEESKRWANELTSIELHAIRKYTKNSLETGNERYNDKFFAKINEYLRCKQKEIGIYDEFYEKYSDSISSGINKFNLKENVVCYRGSNHDETNNTPVGEIFNNPSFFSTSISEKMAFSKKYSYTIYVPRKTRCAFVNSISNFKNQNELLIDKDTKFKVLSRMDNHFELEVIL